MDLPIYFLLKLYIPLFISLVLFVSIFFLKINPNDSTKISLSFFGFLNYNIPISNINLIRFLLLVSTVFLLSTYLFYDYSDFFPKRLTMEVFFDKEGIRQNILNYFNDEDLKKLNIPQNYEQYQEIYYSDLDSELKKIITSKHFFTVRNGIIHSEGSTTFFVEKIHGIQKYFIKESKGELTHVLEQPGKNKVIFRSFFEKINSSNDYISPSIIDIFIRHEIILKPMFKQIIAEEFRSDGTIFHHTLLGITKVKMFPYPEYGNTIYFFKTNNNLLIPIGYAVYR